MSELVPKSTLSLGQREAAKILASNDVHGLTIKEVAELIGVTERTVYRWKQDPAFVDYQNQVAEQLMEDFLAEAYVELRKIVRSSQSEKSKLKAIEMALSNRGKLRNTQEITHKVEQEYDLESKKKQYIDMDIDKLD